MSDSLPPSLLPSLVPPSLSLQLPPPNLSSPTATLTDTLRPLVRKRVQTSSAHSMLLLWLLDTLVTQLPIVEVSTGKSCDRHMTSHL